MKDKYMDEEFAIDEDKHAGGLRLRQETELFDDESYIKFPILNVRRLELPNNGEDWEFLQDKTVVFILKGVQLTKKERNYLRTPEGMLFLISGFKQGWNTVTKIKKQLKTVL